MSDQTMHILTLKHSASSGTKVHLTPTGQKLLKALFAPQPVAAPSMPSRAPSSKPVDKPDYPLPDCPLCSTPMRLRNGARGPFFGCVNYPKCTGIVDQEEWENQLKAENPDLEF